MGEFEFIETIRRAFQDIGESGNGRGELLCAEDGYLGIGDDCAVFPIGGGEALVMTTDMLVEGVHFLRPGAGSAREPDEARELRQARELGAKALAVNLSDVAAMGARPVASLLSIALPPECRGCGNAHSGWADEFMEGYRELSARHGVKLAGGDTTASATGGVAINVVAIGRAPLGRLKYRSGARPGDIVAVGGPLGESAAGLADILAGNHDTPNAHIHRNPTPQVAEGQWLGGRPEVHAMTDLSDGLASDLRHILKASCEEMSRSRFPSPGGVAAGTADGVVSAETSLSAEIELSAIPTPVSPELAVTGGEDYKLLLTVDPEAWPALAADYREMFGTPLHAVGRLSTGQPQITWLENGVPVTKNWHGFVHF